MATPVRLGGGTNSLTNHVMSAGSGEAPEVGKGATILAWTDRYAGTITTVAPSGKSFVVTENTPTRTDTNGMSESQTYTYAPNPEGRTWEVRLTKSGWRTTGGARRGMGVLIGARRAYHDYSF